MMGVFNNLVMYDQHVAQNRPTRSFQTSPRMGVGEDGKELTFKLRQGSNGMMASRSPRPTSITWDLLLGTAAKSSASTAQILYRNLERVTTKGDFEVGS